MAKDHQLFLFFLFFFYFLSTNHFYTTFQLHSSSKDLHHKNIKNTIIINIYMLSLAIPLYFSSGLCYFPMDFCYYYLTIFLSSLFSDTPICSASAVALLAGSTSTYTPPLLLLLHMLITSIINSVQTVFSFFEEEVEWWMIHLHPLSHWSGYVSIKKIVSWRFYCLSFPHPFDICLIVYRCLFWILLFLLQPRFTWGDSQQWVRRYISSDLIGWGSKTCSWKIWTTKVIKWRH